MIRLIRRHRGMLALGLVLVMLISLATGCTKQETPKENDHAGTPASAGLLDEIKAKGKVVVGTEAAFEPFEFVENGKIVGYGADILKIIAEDLGVEVEQLDLPFQGILPGLQAKKFDFVATSVLVTPERAEKYAFTVPIADGTVAILKRKGDDSIKTIEDISGKVVGTQLASGPEAALKAYDEELKAQGKEGVKDVKLYQAFPEAYVELASGRVDAVAQALPNLSTLIKKQPDKYEVVGMLEEKIWISWVVRQEDEDLLEFLNQEIIKLKDNGKLAELQMKWFGFTMDTPTADFLPAGN